MIFRSACCSSSTTSVIEKSLADMGIAKYFSLHVSAEQIEHPKPAPDIYLYAAEKLNVPPENCWVYEDSQIGIEAGKRAGMKVIARREVRFCQNQAGSDIIVNSAAELCRLLCKGKDQNLWKK